MELEQRLQQEVDKRNELVEEQVKLRERQKLQVRAYEYKYECKYEYL